MSRAVDAPIDTVMEGGDDNARCTAVGETAMSIGCPEKKTAWTAPEDAGTIRPKDATNVKGHCSVATLMIAMRIIFTITNEKVADTALRTHTPRAAP